MKNYTVKKMQTTALGIMMSGQFTIIRLEADIFLSFLNFVNKRRKKQVPYTYKGTDLSNHYYMYCHYVIISSNHERKATFWTLFGILVTADHHH